jgi:hypothetical protein
VPETRLTRALLSAVVLAIVAVVVLILLRFVLWLVGEDTRWLAVFLLIFVAGFAIQWWSDRSFE